MNRANKIISKEEDKKAEIRHARSTLGTNRYQEWMFKTKTKKKDSKSNSTNSTKTRTSSIGLPYIKGLSEKLTPIFKQHGGRSTSLSIP